MQGAITTGLISFFLRNQRSVWILSVFDVVLFGYLGTNAYRELQVMPQEPEHVVFEQLLHRPSGRNFWVIVDDARWDCQNFVYSRSNWHADNGYSYIIFSNPAQTMVGIASYTYEADCDQISRSKPLGVISLLTDKKKAFLIGKGIDFSRYPNARSFVNLCTDCGRSDSQLGVILAPIFILIGISLPFLVNYCDRKPRSGKRDVIIYG